MHGKTRAYERRGCQMNKRMLWLTGSVAVALLLVVTVFSVTALAEEERLLCGFNSEEDLELFEWSAARELSEEHATEGDKCVKVTFSGQTTAWPGFNSSDKELLSGWEKYDFLLVDIHNPGEKVTMLNVRIDDPKIIDDPKTKNDDWTSWFSQSWKVFPGKNTLKIELHNMATPNRVRTIRPEDVIRLSFFKNYGGRYKKNPPIVLYIDNLRLEKTARVELPKGMQAFDIGAKNSVVWPGFTLATKSTRYSDAAGYGFTKIGNWLRGWDFKIPDNIGRDCINIGSSRVVFSVKVSPGTYKVWVLTGNLAGRNITGDGYKVSAEGKQVFEKKQEYATFLDALDPLQFEYKKSNESLWDVFAAPCFEDVFFEVECADGVLDIAIIKTAKSVHLCALAVWPAQNKEGAEFVAKTNAARKKSFDERFREIKPKVDTEKARPTRKEKAHGFILTKRNYLEPVGRYSVPKAEERFKKISIAACPGEFEPAVFVIHPVRNVEGVEIKTTPLAGRAGTIPASAIKIERTMFRYIPSRSMDSYSIEPCHLVRQTSLDLEAGVPMQVWATVHVPDDAVAGKYKGTVTVGSGNRDATFELELEVYPFELEKPKAIYAHAYVVPKEPERMEMDITCMIEHGFNSVTPGMPTGRPEKVDGKLQLDFSLDDLFMEKMKQAGMTGPVPLFNMSLSGAAGAKTFPHMAFLRRFGYNDVTDPRYLDDLTELTKLIVKNAKEKDWLPVIMYPITEMSNDKRLGPDFMRKLIKAIRKAGDVKCVASVNGPREVENVKDLDIIMYNGGVPINEKTIQAAHDAGCELWFQNIGGTRFNEGLYLLRTGAVGRRQFAFNFHYGNPYSDFQYFPWSQRLCGGAGSLFVPSKEGALPRFSLEWMREGVDDYRYFQTLRNLIAKAEKAGRAKAEAAAAKKDYDEMIASCPVEVDLSLPPLPDGFKTHEGFRDKDTFDRYRRRVARHIIKIRKVLGE